MDQSRWIVQLYFIIISIRVQKYEYIGKSPNMWERMWDHCLNICRSSICQHFPFITNRYLHFISQNTHKKEYIIITDIIILLYLIKCHPGCIVCNMSVYTFLPFSSSLINLLISMRFSLLIEYHFMLNPLLLIVSRLKRF